MKIRIKSFNGELPSYLMLDKEYQVMQESEYFHQYVIDDEDDAVFFDLHNCPHLNGGSWEIVSE